MSELIPTMADVKTAVIVSGGIIIYNMFIKKYLVKTGVTT